MANSNSDFSLWYWVELRGKTETTVDKVQPAIQSAKATSPLYDDLITFWVFIWKVTWDPVTWRIIRIIRTSAWWTWWLLSIIYKSIYNKNELISYEWPRSMKLGQVCSLKVSVVSKYKLYFGKIQSKYNEKSSKKWEVIKNRTGLLGKWHFLLPKIHRHMLEKGCKHGLNSL